MTEVNINEVRLRDIVNTLNKPHQVSFKVKKNSGIAGIATAISTTAALTPALSWLEVHNSFFVASQWAIPIAGATALIYGISKSSQEADILEEQKDQAAAELSKAISELKRKHSELRLKQFFVQDAAIIQRQNPPEEIIFIPTTKKPLVIKQRLRVNGLGLWSPKEYYPEVTYLVEETDPEYPKLIENYYCVRERSK